MRIVMIISTVFSLITAGCAGSAPNTANAPTIRATPRPDTVAMLLAVREGKPDTVRTLIASGAELNARDEAGNTALIEAARFGHEDIARELIATRADVTPVNNAGETALSVALRNGHEDIALMLRQAGAQR